MFESAPLRCLWWFWSTRLVLSLHLLTTDLLPVLKYFQGLGGVAHCGVKVIKSYKRFEVQHWLSCPGLLGCCVNQQPLGYFAMWIQFSLFRANPEPPSPTPGRLLLCAGDTCTGPGTTDYTSQSGRLLGMTFPLVGKQTVLSFHTKLLAMGVPESLREIYLLSSAFCWNLYLGLRTWG